MTKKSTPRLPWWFTEIKLLRPCYTRLRVLRSHVDAGKSLRDIIREAPHGDLTWFISRDCFDPLRSLYNAFARRFDIEGDGEGAELANEENLRSFLLGPLLFSTSVTRLEDMLRKVRSARLKAKRLLKAEQLVRDLEDQVKAMRSASRRGILRGKRATAV